MEVRGLRESVEILKGQKRVVMKERDGLRERLEEIDGYGENTLMGKTTEGAMMMNDSRVYGNSDNRGNGIRGNNNNSNSNNNNNNDDSKRNINNNNNNNSNN